MAAHVWLRFDSRLRLRVSAERSRCGRGRWRYRVAAVLVQPWRRVRPGGDCRAGAAADLEIPVEAGFHRALGTDVFSGRCTALRFLVRATRLCESVAAISNCRY